MSQLIDTVGGLWLRPYVLPEAQRVLDRQIDIHFEQKLKLNVLVTCKANLKDGSAQTNTRAATLKYK